MSEDSYTEVTHKSWFSRIGGAFKGIIFGFVLFIAAFPLLFWNEGRAVKTYKTLKEGSGAVVSVSADKVDPVNEGKLIHLSGKAVTEALLTDPIFGVSSANALKLQRQVEMYQWHESSKSETKKKLGGGEETVTTYSYSTNWSNHAISSSSFKKSAGHENPDSMPYESEELVADKVTLGAFTLSPSLVSRISGSQALPVNSDIPLPKELEGKAKRHAGGFYIGANPVSPQVGDVRITFKTVPAQDISVVAQQTGGSFVPYQASTGENIELLQAGIVTADAMFKKAQSDNALFTWILRAVGFVLMFAGLGMIFKVLSVLADVLPFLGNVVGAGTGIIAFLIAAVLSLITIAVAWVVYRPLLGIALLAVAVGLIVLVKGKLGAAKQQQAAAMPPSPPPLPA
ncbi:TMEM43 family protein [Candidatus Electronema sp. PJ]|uniref:TMEM43 family protein n=1 Tax=Candidatus Electronema sp. PJ TaxID=3401572 RepID=UPI003AA99849